MPELAGDAVRCSTRRGSRSAHVYGLSMGGMIAQELAIRFPERVRGLVLGGTTPGGPRAALPTLRELARARRRAPQAPHASPGAPGWRAGCSRREFRREHPERAASCCASSPPPRAAAGHGRALVGERLPRHGVAPGPHPGARRSSSTARPTRWRRSPTPACWPRAIPDAELAIVEGAGHAYLLEEPEALARPAGRLDGPPRSPIAPGHRAHRARRDHGAAHPAVRAADRGDAGRAQPGIARAAGALPGPVPPRDTPSG